MVQMRRLGGSGLAVSALGIGCNNFGRPNSKTENLAGVRAVVDSAIAAGVNFFDTADIYGQRDNRSESLLGEALGAKRDQVIIATKFGMDMRGANGPDFGARGSRRYIRVAVEASLRRLKTDYIDLYQMHEPDPLTPLEESLAALNELIAEGKVRYIGHSNFAGWQLTKAQGIAERHGWQRFISAQNEYSLLRRGAEVEVLPAAQDSGLGLLPYYPLYNGILTGKYLHGARPKGARVTVSRPHLFDEVPWQKLERYEQLCARQGVTMLQATIAWLLYQVPVTSVIAGATTPEQVAQNVDAAAVVLDAETIAAIGEIFA